MKTKSQNITSEYTVEAGGTVQQTHAAPRSTSGPTGIPAGLFPRPLAMPEIPSTTQPGHREMDADERARRGVQADAQHPCLPEARAHKGTARPSEHHDPLPAPHMASCHAQHHGKGSGGMEDKRGPSSFTCLKILNVIYSLTWDVVEEFKHSMGGIGGGGGCG